MRHEVSAEAQRMGRETLGVEIDAGAGVEDTGAVVFIELDAHTFLSSLLVYRLFIHIGQEAHIGSIAGVVELRIHQQGLSPLLLPFEGAEGIAPTQVEVHRSITFALGFRIFFGEYFHHRVAEVLTIIGRKGEFAVF